MQNYSVVCMPSCSRMYSRISEDSQSIRRSNDEKGRQLVLTQRRLSQLESVRDSLSRQNEASIARLGQQREAIARLARFQAEFERSEERSRIMLSQRESVLREKETLQQKLQESIGRTEEVELLLDSARATISQMISRDSVASSRGSAISLVDLARDAKNRKGSRGGESKTHSDHSDSEDSDTSKRERNSRLKSRGSGNKKQLHSSIMSGNSGSSSETVEERLQAFLEISKEMRSTLIATADEPTLKMLEAEIDSSLLSVRNQREENIRLQKLAAENERQASKESKLCCICMEKEKSCLLLPCKHMCVCGDCGGDERLEDCPICRQSIESRMDIYA